jgi:hypothetical protein
VPLECYVHGINKVLYLEFEDVVLFFSDISFMRFLGFVMQADVYLSQGWTSSMLICAV